MHPHAKDQIVTRLDLAYQFPTVQIPHPEGMIVSSTDDDPGRSIDGDGSNEIFVAFQCPDQGLILRVVDFDQSIVIPNDYMIALTRHFLSACILTSIGDSSPFAERDGTHFPCYAS